ncbi:hypothetical protein ACQPZJ_31700 [Actinoplanes sp. CA-054009]
MPFPTGIPAGRRAAGRADRRRADRRRASPGKTAGRVITRMAQPARRIITRLSRPGPEATGPRQPARLVPRRPPERARDLTLGRSRPPKPTRLRPRSPSRRARPQPGTLGPLLLSKPTGRRESRLRPAGMLLSWSPLERPLPQCTDLLPRPPGLKSLLPRPADLVRLLSRPPGLIGLLSRAADR